MMKVQLPGNSTKTAQRWLQDPSERRVLLPNGVTLDSTQFTADADGQLIVKGGTVIGRADGEEKFGPAAGTDTELYFLWKTINITTEGELAEAVRAGAIFEGLLPEPLDPAVRTKLLDRGFQFIPYPGTGIDE